MTDRIITETARIAENLERENKRLREALETIRDSHIGDQPAALNVDDAQWARRCHGELRAVARDVLRHLGY